MWYENGIRNEEGWSLKKIYMLGLNNIQMMSLPSLFEDKRCCDQVKDSSQLNFIVKL